MNVLHIGTADNSGGAAKAAYRLVQGLRRAGNDCRMLVGEKWEKDDAGVDVIPRTDSFLRKVHVKGTKRIEAWTGLQYLLQTWGARFLRHPFFLEADVIHFHNLHSNFYPLRLVHKMAELKPLVWTFHDMWPMTGHCTYPDQYGCEKFTTGCRQCPHLEDYPRIHLDTTPLLFALKEREYAPSRIRQVIAPSEWMKNQILRSRIFSGHQVTRIPYGVDTDLFCPRERTALRARHQIAPDEKVLMFSALDLTYERKGGTYFLEAVRQLRGALQYSGKLVLLAVGHRGTFPLELPGVRVYTPGLVNSDALMCELYNLADVYVHPALADNLPNAVLESLACGTPIAAFAAGGVPDMVRHGVTGTLAKPKDSLDLARCIQTLLDSTQWAQISDHCRKVAVSEYALSVQTARMMELYDNVLKS